MMWRKLKPAGDKRLLPLPHGASPARTFIFVPELDRLYLAERAQGQKPAAIWEFRRGL
jgi:hypothetical protein